LTLNNAGTGTWCAEVSQDSLELSGNFYIISTPSGQTLSGKVTGPDGASVAGATVYIPGGATFPDMGYKGHALTGSVDEDSIQIISNGAGSVEFSGSVNTNTYTAKGSYDRGTPPDAGTWDGSKIKTSTISCMCQPPTNPYVTYACTDNNGEFVLDASSASNGSLDVSAFKGSLKKSVFVQDIDNFQTIQLGQINVAVVTGNFDRMEDLLAKLGMGDLDSNNKLLLGSQKFDLYDGVNMTDNDGNEIFGNNSLDATYPNFDALFNGPNDTVDVDNALIYGYDIVFINCGNIYEHPDNYNILGDPDVITILQKFVNDGGKLYVTDISYDFIEQAFPDFITFVGDDLEMNAAQQGADNVTTNATINDTKLTQWLKIVLCNGTACLNPDDTVLIDGFTEHWAVIDYTTDPEDVWVEGLVSWIDPDDPQQKQILSGTKPLTVTFDYGDGAVLFTSYHTSETGLASFTPQERILQYLVFYLIETE
jgi:hypothetical protein